MKIGSFESYLALYSDLKCKKVTTPSSFVEAEYEWWDQDDKSSVYTYGNDNFSFAYEIDADSYISIPIKKINEDDFIGERVGSPFCRKIVQYIIGWRSSFEDL